MAQQPKRGAMSQLVALAWPIVGLNVLQVATLVVDTAMVGRIPGAETALIGMGYAGQLVFLLMVAMIGLTVGTVAIVARAHGAGETDRVNHVFHQSTQLTVLVGLFVAVAGNLLAEPVLRLLGATDAALEPGLAYLRPLLTGTAFTYLNILYPAILRGVGDTRLAFAAALVMNGLNVLFNYGLVLGGFGVPAMGIAGAALGTVAAQLCGAALMFTLLRRVDISGLRPRLRIVAIDRALVRRLFRVGFPAALDLVVLNAALLTIITMLASIDEIAVAAHTLGLRVQSLAFVPGLSISQATGAMVGNALGAGSVDRARRVVRSSILLSTAIMTTLGAIILFFAGPIVVELFAVTPGSVLHGYAIMWMELLGYGMPFVGVYISFAGMLQGAGSTMTSLKINAWTTALVQIPGSYLLGFPLGLGAWGVWAAFPLTFVFKLIWGYLEYRRGAWAKVGDQP